MFLNILHVYKVLIINTNMTEEEKKIMSELWLRIQKKRQKLKISQEELSWILDMDRSYLSMVEKWKANIAYLKLRKIVQALDMEIK